MTWHRPSNVRLMRLSLYTLPNISNRYRDKLWSSLLTCLFVKSGRRHTDFRTGYFNIWNAQEGPFNFNHWKYMVNLH